MRPQVLQQEGRQGGAGEARGADERQAQRGEEQQFFEAQAGAGDVGVPAGVNVHVVGLQQRFIQRLVGQLFRELVLPPQAVVLRADRLVGRVVVAAVQLLFV